MSTLNIAILILSIGSVYFNLQRFYRLFINSRSPSNCYNVLEDMRKTSLFVIPWMLLLTSNIALTTITLVFVLTTIFLYLGGIIMYIEF